MKSNRSSVMKWAGRAWERERKMLSEWRNVMSEMCFFRTDSWICVMRESKRNVLIVNVYCRLRWIESQWQMVWWFCLWLCVVCALLESHCQAHKSCYMKNRTSFSCQNQLKVDVRWRNHDLPSKSVKILWQLAIFRIGRSHSTLLKIKAILSILDIFTRTVNQRLTVKLISKYRWYRRKFLQKSLSFTYRAKIKN